MIECGNEKNHLIKNGTKQIKELFTWEKVDSPRKIELENEVQKPVYHASPIPEMNE